MRAFPSAWTALAAGLAAFALARSTPAALLDEPPKLYTFKLDDPSAQRLPLLDPFRDAAVDPSGGLRRYLSGTWGRWRAKPWWALSWQSASSVASVASVPFSMEETPVDAPLRAVDAQLLQADHDGDALHFGFAPTSPRSLRLVPEAAPLWLSRLDPGHDLDAPFVPTTGPSFRSNGFDALWSLPPKKVVPDWRCRRRPVRIGRYGGESDAFPLVRCNGAVAPEAYDRLTILAREATAPRPGDLLPDEPDAEALSRGEWGRGVRLVHPRLLWALQRLADAFPWRTIYVYSGYRHDPSFRTAKPGSHHSMHSEARALDLMVMGIPNAAVFQVCRQLEDIGCGFYPNNRFIHLDVRRPGSGHPLWIDVSAPGEPSRYADSWPGVVDGGGLVWDAAAQRVEQAQAAVRGGAESSCVRRSAPP